MDIYSLTAADVKMLREMAEDYRKRRPSNTRSDAVDPGQAPDVYIALPPTTGIPALTTTGTGTFDNVAGDTPGSAECDIYRLIDGNLEYAGFSKVVYNFSESVADYNWILVQRDKFGTWFTSANSGKLLKIVTDCYCDGTSLVVTTEWVYVLSVR